MITTTPSLREARAAELELLVLLVAEYYAFDSIAYEAGEIRRGLQTLLDSPSLGRVWLLEAEGETAGYAVLTFGYDHELGGRTGTLTDFYLREAFRGRGMGRAALAQIESEARDLGLRALELQATRENHVALALYRKSGYQSFDRVPMAKRL